jgi:acetyl esterase/lipase
MNLVVVSAYRKMLERYPASEISIIGDSAGAALAVGMLKFIRALRPGIPVPSRLILVSPGQLVIDEGEHPDIVIEMRAIEQRDIMLSMRLLNSIDSLRIEASGYDEEDVMSDKLFEGDFSGFPPTAVFIGTDEIFYPLVRELLIPAMERSGVPSDLIVGHGMCHVWPYIPFVPESTRAMRRIIEILRGPS